MKIGKISESVLKRSVLRQIKTKRPEIVKGAGVGADCAFFASAPGECLTSCMQEGPAREVEHLLLKCANNLAAGGSEPVGAMLSLLLPESIEEAQIREILQRAEAACSSLSIQLAGGQTRVTKLVNAPAAVVSGYGRISEELLQAMSGPRPGQDIVVSKWIGLEGTALLAGSCREKLLARYPAYFVEEAASFERYYSILPEAATAVKSGVCAMHDASEGGIFAALWELAESAGAGLTLDLKKLPLRQETVEVCECCGINPYELLSGGCLVMASRDGEALVQALAKQQIPAVTVGRLTEGRERIIRNEEEVRYMDRPRTDEIYKIYESGAKGML